MQGKGLVKLLALAVTAICIYQLAFTFWTSRIEKSAETYAISNLAPGVSEEEKGSAIKSLTRAYLDSIQDQPGFLGYTYKDCKSKSLNLGLDLQGGMSVVLQVARDKAIQSIAGGTNNPKLLNALESANQREAETQQDYVSLFGEEFQRLNPGTSLASIFANSPDYSDQINFNSTDDEVIALLKTETENAIETTFEIIRTRIDKFGVTQPNISLQKNTGRILVELPGVDDAERVRNLLQAEANLEFWEVFQMDNAIGTALTNANDILKDKLGIADVTKEKALDSPDNTDLEGDDLLTENSDSTELSDEEVRRQNPLFSIFTPYQTAGNSALGIVSKSNSQKLMDYLNIPEVKAAFPKNLKFVLSKSAFDSEDNDGNPVKLLQVFAIKSRFGDNFKPVLDGGVITDASSQMEQNGAVNVNMGMNAEGAKKWKNLTRENINKPIAVVLDNSVYTAPNILSEIGGGRSQITGDFTLEEGQDLANILKIGKLPAPARIVQDAVVGPTLGAESIQKGLISLLVGILMVLGFMIFYYNKGGVVSVLALVLNLFFIIGILASLGTTLTLPGIAGIVLTIGMAVDANVIIYERIREELANGLGTKKAIAEGFRKSYSAIIDANLTTLITAMVLAYFGLGPVLGFAVILIIGIFSSMFTAVLLSRLVIDWAGERGTEMKFASGIELFKNANFDFVSKRKLNYIISGVLLTLGIAAIALRGFELGVDFQGGRTYQVAFDQDVSTADIGSALTDKFGTAPLVTTYDNDIRITTAYEIGSTDTKMDSQAMGLLFEGVKGFYKNPPTYETFVRENIMSSQKVGPTIADDIRTGSFKATLFALIGIFFYIFIRFRKWQFGLAAVLTVIHDTLILLSIFALGWGILPFGMEINQAFIAAMLTVIGYSINDTVVVFDRIREYLVERGKKEDSLSLINQAINSTLSRTIITSLTTLFVVLVLFIFGGEVIRGFAFALLIGIIVGTYSSIFIATPLVIDLSGQDVKIESGGPSTVKKPLSRAERAMQNS